MKVLEFDTDDFNVILSTNDDISKSWKRFCSHVRTKDHTSKSYCLYSSNFKDTKLSLYNYDNNSLSEYIFDYESENLWPVVFETNKYQVSIKVKESKHHIEILHRNKDVVESFYDDEDLPNKKIGNIEILNNPGIFKLEFQYTKQDKKHIGSVSFEVVSPKMDTKTDYKSILRAVNLEYENIIYHYLATTYQQFKRGKEHNDQTWIQAFESVVDDYLYNIKRIIDHPNIISKPIINNRRIDKIKKISPSIEREYLETIYKDKSLLERKQFRNNEYESSINTLENRFVKHTLISIGNDLKRIFNRIIKENQDKLSAQYQEHIKSYQEEIIKYQRHPFFYGIGKFEGFSNLSMVLQSRYGYQQIYKDWLKLKQGIDLYEGSSNIGTLQIWEIYELWCFVKMKQLIREVLDISNDTPDFDKLVIEPKGSLLNPFTNSNLYHIVEYHYPQPNENTPTELKEKLLKHSEDIITLEYQHTFTRKKVDDKDVLTATTEQRPDIVLNIRKPNGKIVLTYLYDAKYRVISDIKLDKEFEEEDINEINNIDGIIGADYPPPDSINQMHRYRDAIYYNNGKEKYASKEVIGGYILFPGRYDDKSLSQRYFTQSIKKINIGAFPLTPNEENPEKEGSILKEHLINILLNYSSEEEHIKDAIPQRGLKYESIKEFSKEGLIFICVSPTEEKFNWCIKNKSYPIPLNKAHSEPKLLQSQYILLHCGDKFHLSHIVKGNILLKSNEELCSMGYPNTNHEFYMLIKLNPDYVNRIYPNIQFTKEKLKEVFGKKLNNALFYEDVSILKQFIK